MFFANTTASFGRSGSTTDVFGDEVTTTDGEYYATEIPVAITTQTRTILLPQSGEPRTVVSYVGRVHSRINVKSGDTIKDERTDREFVIDDVAYANSSIGIGSCILALRQV